MLKLKVLIYFKYFYYVAVTLHGPRQEQPEYISLYFDYFSMWI